MTKNPRYGIKDIAIAIALLALLLLLAQLFMQPARPARDLVFGELGRVHSALTNLTESSSESPIAVATNHSAAPPPSAALPVAESNRNPSLTTPIQLTNDAMADAVAAAIAAPTIVNNQNLPSLTPPPEARPVITASVPPPPPARIPSKPPPPYTPAPGPEPDSKPSTADLLATVKGDAPAPLENRPTSTEALLGLGTGKTTAATASVLPGRPLPVMAGETNVSFLVDQSLSMKRNGKTSRARSELLSALETLGAAKTFYVLFFHSGGYEGMPGLGPVPATPDNIRAMTNWLFSVGHRFGSDPVKAMRRALSIVPPPDTVWLISDGEFSKTAVQTIRDANETVHAHINTVALYSADGEQVMRQIADENGGICRFISPPP